MSDEMIPPGNELNQLAQEEIARFPAPWGRELRLIGLRFDSGFPMLRLSIKEGKRFTTLDLDGETAEKLVRLMSDWCASTPRPPSER